jgi:hypothetical protein
VAVQDRSGRHWLRQKRRCVRCARLPSQETAPVSIAHARVPFVCRTAGAYAVSNVGIRQVIGKRRCNGAASSCRTSTTTIWSTHRMVVDNAHAISPGGALRAPSCSEQSRKRSRAAPWPLGTMWSSNASAAAWSVRMECSAFRKPAQSSLGIVKVTPSSSGVISIWHPSLELSSRPQARSSMSSSSSSISGSVSKNSSST